MTTEDDFQRILDAQPDDHHTRLVFADWLDERGDPRAAGYRALGMNKWRPIRTNTADNSWAYSNNDNHLRDLYRVAMLDTSWWELLEPTTPVDSQNLSNKMDRWVYYESRRAAEDNAATVFPQLSFITRFYLLPQSV